MLTVLLPENRYSPPLRELLEPLLPEGSVFRDPDAGLEGLTGQRLLFAVALDEGGCSEAYYRMLSRLRRSTTLLRGCVAGLVVTGVGVLHKGRGAGHGVRRQPVRLRLSGAAAGGGHRLPAELPHPGPDRRHR